MTIQTKIYWGRQTTPQEKTDIETEIEKYISLGVTDGISILENENVRPTVIRNWTTAESANNWIAFINTVAPAPVSAEVVEI